MQGWECPKCHAVWAPHITKCSNCVGAILTQTITGTTWPYLSGTCQYCYRPYHMCRGHNICRSGLYSDNQISI